MMHVETPSDELLKEVHAHLVARGTSLSGFCNQHGDVRQAVTIALQGVRSGPKSTALMKAFLAKVRETA